MVNAYTLLVLFACGALASAAPWPNVGTVLFSRSDVNKQKWSKNEVAVLRARKYFQSLLPAPSFTDVDKYFVEKHLRYFRNAFLAVKKEAPDPATDRILTTALSDAAGGFLRLYVLPFTKVAFYSGTVTYTNAYKAFKFYSEITSYLNTNGSGWRDPDKKMISAITINMLQKSHRTFIRSYKDTEDPCQYFTYFEKAHDGLTIPMPVVNWDDVTMFLPLKNESTFSLHSPSHCNTLENYYTKARSCMHMKGDSNEYDFDEKFQQWLTSDIIPHLKDDYLYVALGNVLTLLNHTMAMCDYVIQAYERDKIIHIPKKLSTFKPMCSKTTIVMLLVLSFEIIWCMVALYKLCHRISSRHSLGTNRINFFKSPHNKYECLRTDDKGMQDCIMYFTDAGTSNPSNTRLRPPGVDVSCNDFGYIKMPMKDCECQCIPNQSRVNVGVSNKPTQSSFLCQVRSNDVMKVVKERIKDFSAQIVPRPNVSYTKVPGVCGVIGCEAKYGACACCQEQADFKRKTSSIGVYWSQLSLESASNIYEPQTNSQNLDKNVSERENKQVGLKLSSSPNKFECPCLNCTAKSDSSVEISHQELEVWPSRDSYKCYNTHVSPSLIRRSTQNNSSIIQHKALTGTQTLIMRVDKETETQQPQNKKTTHPVSSGTVVTMPRDKKNRHGKRYLEIKIDRPNTEIKVGILNAQDRQSPRKGSSKVPTKKNTKHTTSNSTPSKLGGGTKVIRLLQHVDKSIESSPISCSEQATAYSYMAMPSRSFEYALHDFNTITKQQQQQLDDAALRRQSEQDETVVASNISKDDISSITKDIKQNENAETVSVKVKHGLTLKKSDTDSSKQSFLDAIAPSSDSLHSGTTIVNQVTCEAHHGESINDNERLIHTIYEHSKEALLSALANEEEKAMKEEAKQQSSASSVFNETDSIRKKNSISKSSDFRVRPERCKSAIRERGSEALKSLKINDRNPEVPKFAKTIEQCPENSKTSQYQIKIPDTKTIKQRCPKTMKVKKQGIVPERQKPLKDFSSERSRIPKRNDLSPRTTKFGSREGSVDEIKMKKLAHISSEKLRLLEPIHTPARTSKIARRVQPSENKAAKSTDDNGSVSTQSNPSPRYKSRIPKLNRQLGDGNKKSEDKNSRLNASF